MEKLHFLIRWPLINFAGIIIGYITGGIILLLIHGAFGFDQDQWGTPLSQTLGHMAAGAILGLVLGFFQRSLLLKFYPVPVLWVYTPVIAFVIVELLAGIFLALTGINRGEIKFFEYETPGTIPGETLIYATAGLFTGILQWLLLRRTFPNGSIWIFASTLGWTVCIMITMVSFWAFFAGALLYGFITGIGLIWTMKRELPERSGDEVLNQQP